MLGLVVELRVFLARRNPLLWDSARRQMRWVLERTLPEADIDEAAVRYLRSMYWRNERRWRPHLVTSQPVEGVERVLAARDPERGLLITFMHHANYDGSFASLAGAGLPTKAFGAALMFDAGTAEYIKQHRRIIEMGSTIISSAEGFAGLRAALEAGDTVAIAPDVAGSTPVEFVGRQVLGSFGAARAAFDTNAQVVVCTFHRDPKAVARIRLSPVLEPRDFPDARALLTEILQRHEASILEWPEAHERPMQRWGRTTDEERAIFGDVDDPHPI